ncbi:bifunctional adenosylcobinamide kinase/adenosylcobinamide-phosphate guanylyltransferase [Aestuariimicrobium kwangyangense]|uniref:bifunctional adenosylcobinamide kinase/adenosylcobinamide-phosphate guanylyltransferase n=1 Tax=Aestuariimicrobium kwangyangense TaxID=396389 RepID=UPI0003B34A58|nr:bifunctional adenosylcobinamide kinase/adenosylcobinamide-phosphate guanylyltransferase [Aestuariimicrobium kwangyangense]
MRTLVTGGTRSGKSAIAEGLVPDRSTLRPDETVVYVACGPSSDDEDWNHRVALHRRRRPAHWQTWETVDLAEAIDRLAGPCIVDCLGTWLTAQLDDLDAWSRPADEITAELRSRVDAVAQAVARCPHPLVVVTNEVGQSLISMERSGRLFTDWLGWLNQAVAASCDRVVLVVAGCPLVVKGEAWEQASPFDQA